MSNNKYKVLLIEDESNICSFVSTILETNSYQILCAKSLHFVHPLTGEKLDLFSQLEADLKKS